MQALQYLRLGFENLALLWYFSADERAHLLLPITSVSLLAALAFLSARAEKRSGLAFGLAIWAVAVALTAVPLFVYEAEYSIEVDAFVAGALLSLAAGFLAVRRTRRSPRTASTLAGTEASFGYFLAAVGILGNLLLVASAIQKGVDFSPTFLTQNLEDIRDAGRRSEEVGAGGPLVLVGGLLAPAGLLFLIVMPLLSAMPRKIARPLALTNGVLIAVVALFVFAGRQSLIVALFLLVIGFWLRGRKLIKLNVRTALVVAVALSGIWYFATSFATSRQSASNPDYLLEVVSRADYKPWIATEAINNDTAGAALFQFSYFTSPIPTLTFYLDQKPVPGPFYGGYSFPLPSKIAATALGTATQNQWQEVRRQVFAPLEHDSHLGNVWATWLRDLIVDFGIAGALFFSLAFGGLIAWARNRYDATGGVFFHAVEVLTVGTFAFGAFQNLLYTTDVAYAFGWAIGSLAVLQLLKKSQ